jgi:hypothetical protein
MRYSLMIFRHACTSPKPLKCAAVSWTTVPAFWVERLKGSLSVEHPIAGDELRHQALSRDEHRQAALALCLGARPQ